MAVSSRRSAVSNRFLTKSVRPSQHQKRSLKRSGKRNYGKNGKTQTTFINRKE